MHKPDAEQAKQYISEIDFTMVKFKLTHATLGSGWSLGKANRVEREYRNYLTLLLTQLTGDDVLLPPSHDVDEFWHNHILDTRAYVRDCSKIFGRYLHHFPYFGMRGEQDALDLKKAFEKTSQGYKNLFGEELKGRGRSIHSSEARVDPSSPTRSFVNL